jgi:hypothetical protein
MAYDLARNVTVLFGGVNDFLNPPFLGDTWEWNGKGWTLTSLSGPSPRADAAMAYDSDRGVMVLFGGAGAYGQRFTMGPWEYQCP